MRRRRSLGLLVMMVVAVASAADANPLRGSRASLHRQNEVARGHDFTYLKTVADVRRFVASGYLVPVRSSADIGLKAVSFPYARPEVKTFLERLGRQYRAACGEKLIVTSLTRPESRQPPNASNISVHPTGMAIDLRRSSRAQCRSWLERVLVSLESRGVLEATRERYPPHYHVALFPKPYVRYVASLTTPAEEASTVTASAAGTYRVLPGDSLWEISRRHGTSVSVLRAANGLSGSRLRPGQVLEIPGSTPVVVASTDSTSPATSDEEIVVEVSAEGGVEAVAYRVRRGDSLWKISRRHGTSVGDLLAVNDLSRSRIHPGQILRIPVETVATR